MAQANHRINIYHGSIDKLLSELELRFSGNDQENSLLCEASVTVKHLIKKASTESLNFSKLTARFHEAEQKLYASFRRVSGLLSYMTVPNKKRDHLNMSLE